MRMPMWVLKLLVVLVGVTILALCVCVGISLITGRIK